MDIHRHRLAAFCIAIFLIAGASTSNASILTVIDPNCTGFALGGVAPNQTLDCVGGVGSVANPKSLSIDDRYCGSFSLIGLAPNQTLICNTTGSAAPILVSVVSRKMHGVAGTFDLSLALAPGSPSVEPRTGPAQTIVMTFDRAITAASPRVIEGSAIPGTPTFSGNSVITPLSAVADQQYVTLFLAGVTAAGGGATGNASVRAGFLAGDANRNGVVTGADVGAVNAQLSQQATAANFVFDVNASGAVSIADKGIINGNLTRALPPP